MKTYGIRTEIEPVVSGKYTGYTNVFRCNGQDFPALRDLLGKLVTLRNGDSGHVLQTRDGICVFVKGCRLNVAYGKKLTAYPVNGKGNLVTCHPEKKYDILSVKDADGNLFWERKAPKQKPEPFKMTEKEAIRLLKELYNIDIEITGKGKYGRHAARLSDELEKERELRRNQETEQKSTVSGVNLDETETETKTA